MHMYVHAYIHTYHVRRRVKRKVGTCDFLYVYVYRKINISKHLHLHILTMYEGGSRERSTFKISLAHNVPSGRLYQHLSPFFRAEEDSRAASRHSVRVCEYVYIHMYVCMYIYIYIYICI